MAMSSWVRLLFVTAKRRLQMIFLNIFLRVGFYTGQHASAEGRRGRCAAGPRNAHGRHRVADAACRAAGCQYGARSLRSVQVRNVRLASLKVVGNEKLGGSGRRQMVGDGPGLWRSRIISIFIMQFLSKNLISFFACNAKLIGDYFYNRRLGANCSVRKFQLKSWFFEPKSLLFGLKRWLFRWKDILPFSKYTISKNSSSLRPTKQFVVRSSLRHYIDASKHPALMGDGDQICLVKYETVLSSRILTAPKIWCANKNGAFPTTFKGAPCHETARNKKKLRLRSFLLTREFLQSGSLCSKMYYVRYLEKLFVLNLLKSIFIMKRRFSVCRRETKSSFSSLLKFVLCKLMWEINEFFFSWAR